MKKILLSISAIVLLILIGVTVVKAAPSYFSINSSSSATSTVTMVNPQTTYNYNLDGGFSTLMSDVDGSYVFVLATASSTGTTLQWKVQYSNNNVDWFESDNIIAPAAGQAIVHASSTNTWIIGTTTPATAIGKVITIPQVASLYKRVSFTTSTGTSTIWVQDTEYRGPTN